MPKILDLFSGGGGLTLGAYLAGFETALAVDIDPNLSHSFSLNFPESRHLLADLSNLATDTALDKAGIKRSELTGIVGGPPCQGFSSIGKRDPTDPRNELVGDFFRFVKELRPAFFMMENVPGILVPPFREVLDRHLDSLRNDFKILGPLRLNALDFGAATSRVRVVILGYQSNRVSELSETDIRAAKVKNHATVYEAIHDLPDPTTKPVDYSGKRWWRYPEAPDSDHLGRFARAARLNPPPHLSTGAVKKALKEKLVSGCEPTQHSSEVIARFRKLDQGSTDKVARFPRLSWQKPCPTLRAGTGSDHGSYQALRPIHPAEPRVISVREAARIQGFPDWFQFHQTKWHSFRMIGNSVSPPLASSLLKLLHLRMARS